MIDDNRQKLIKAISRIQQDEEHLIKSIDIIFFYIPPNPLDIKPILIALKSSIEQMKYYVEQLQSKTDERDDEK